MKKKLAILGCGSLGSVIAGQACTLLSDSYELLGVFDINRPALEALTDSLAVKAYASVDELLADKPDIVSEAAGVPVIRLYAEKILSAGISLIPLSIGAFADAELMNTLQNAAVSSGAQIYLPSGAIGGYDIMRSVSLYGNPQVRIDNFKAPASIEGAPYLAGRILPRDHEETVFEGNALQAIEGFPKNVNVAVAAALATVGVKDITVTMISQPDLTANVHRITMATPEVNAVIEVSSRPDPMNPKSSTLAAWSVVSLLKDLASPMHFY